jgi:hypothetical protein
LRQFIHVGRKCEIEVRTSEIGSASTRGQSEKQ